MTRTARRFTVAAALVASLGAVFAVPGPIAAEGDSAEVQLAEDAEPFPLEAKADPTELFLGLDQERVGETQPITVSGRTLPLGDKGVHYDITFRYEEGTDLEPKPVASGEIPVTEQGTFDRKLFTPDNIGIYDITLIAPDGRTKVALEVTTLEPPDEEEPDEATSEAAKTAEEAIGKIEEAIDEMPESPAKDEAKAKLKSAKAEISKLASDPALDRSISGVIGAIRADKDLTDYAQPRLKQLGDGLTKLRAETRRVKNLMGGMSQADIGCHKLAVVSEGFKLVSALLNVKKSVIDIASGLAKDIVADFATNAAKTKAGEGHVGQTLAFAVGQIAKNSPELNRLSGLAGNIYGMMADLGGFITDRVFAEYCQQFTGPVRGKMEAHFFKPQEWWNYSFALTGRIVLYYPKGASGKSIRVTGRIEGVAHSFKAEENALSVLFPGLMASAIQRKRTFPPIDIGAGAAEVAVLGTGSTSGYIEGSAASLALPNSFLISVDGLLEKDSMSVIVGPSKSDFTAAYRVGVLIASHLSIVPVFTWYELPFQNAKHVLDRASQGQAMRIPISTQGKVISGEATFTKPAPSGGEARGSYELSIKLCNPGC